MPFDPNANPTNTPKFLRKNDGVLSGAEVLLNPKLLGNRHTMTRNKASKLYDVPMPEGYNLETNTDYGNYAVKQEVKSKEATITIDLPEDSIDNKKEKQISFDTLMQQFGALFKEPRLTEVYYKEIEGGWRVSFIKDTMLIYCDVIATDIVNYYATDETREIDEETQVGLVAGWKDQFLVKAIKEE